MNKLEKTCYRAYCKNHDWEGMSQYEKSDAEKDLDGHKAVHSDESHENSGVIELEC